MLQPKFGFDRRGFLRMGVAGVVGSTIPIPVSRAGTGDSASNLGKGKAKSVLLIMLSGGPSQLDTVDPKPEAPAEIRGEFGTIGTTISGVSFCEYLPKLAKQTEKWAIVRTLAHQEHNHLLATHIALTGRPCPIPRGATDLDRVETRNDFPNMAAALGYVRPQDNGIPSGVSLPNYLIEGPLTWPGQHSGFLGPKFDPWQIQADPNDKNFRMDALQLREGVTPDRLQSRRMLLEQFQQDRVRPAGAESTAFREQQQSAFNLLSSGKLVDAFEIGRESDAVRDRYGRNKFGQSILLARRLVESGVPIVQATMGIVQTWDTHTDNWGKLKNTLLPQLDQGLEALMEDLSASGLLDQTMVVVMGEFGRTPKISTLPGQTLAGRDHWAHAYSGLFAGAGVVGGQVIGQTDARAAYPVTRSWSPADICSTLFNALGVEHDVTIMDPLQRPHHLLNGTIINPLYTGRTS